MYKLNLGIAICLVVLLTAGGKGMAQAQKKNSATKHSPTKKIQPNVLKRNTQKPIRNMYGNPPDPEMESGFERDLARVKERVDEARDLLESGDSQAAKAKCITAFDVAPLVNDLPVAFQAERLMGEINYAQRNYREALRWFNIYSTTTIDRRLAYDIALCYVRIGDYGNAKRYYLPKSVLQINSSTLATDLPVVHNLQSLEAAILLARSLEYDSIGERKKASDGYDAAARLDPTNMWLHARRAKIALRAGRREEGLALLRKAALSQNPRIVSDARRWLGGDNVDKMRAENGIVDEPKPAN